MKDDLVAATGNGIAWVLTLADLKDAAQLISYILASITSLITIGYILFKWWKKATSEDSSGGKKITKEEIKELEEEIKENVKNREKDL